MAHRQNEARKKRSRKQVGDLAGVSEGQIDERDIYLEA